MALRRHEPADLQEYRVLVVKDRAGLKDLAPEWLALWRHSGPANPFTHPGWVRAWLEHLGQGVVPCLATAWRGPRLVALAPCGLGRVGPWRRLVFLGAPLADYPDLVVAPGEEGAVARLVAGLLDQPWDLVDILDWSAASPHLSPWRRALEDNGLKPILMPGSVCPQVEIKGSWAEYWATKKSKTRFTQNKKEKRLAREAGPLRFEALAQAGPILAALERAGQVHAARWARRHTRTVFSTPAGRAFFEAALPPLAEEGLVRLHQLWAGSELTAFCLSFLTAEAHYYYIPGFDPRWAANSPGHLLLQRLIAAGHDQDGLRLFDFMKGDEDYKERWANAQSCTWRCLAARDNPWARLGLTLRRSFLTGRDRARRSPLIRRAYSGLMDRLTRLRRP